MDSFTHLWVNLWRLVRVKTLRLLALVRVLHLIGHHSGPGIGFRCPALLWQPLMLVRRTPACNGLLLLHLVVAAVKLLLVVVVGVFLQDKGLVGPPGPVVDGPGHPFSWPPS